MKLRQKLAVVLASAMVVTAVPVVTMAASTASVSKVITVSNEDALGTSAPVLKIELKDGFTTGSQFYLELENSKWNKIDDEYVATTVKNANGDSIGQVEPTGDTSATVTLNVNPASDEKLFISLENVKVTGEAKITIDGAETEVDKATIAFANKSDAKATVTAKDAKTFYTTTVSGEEVGTIVVSEAVKGSLKVDEAKDRTITIEMEHSDFVFTGDAVTVKGTRGFSSVGSIQVTPTLADDKETLTIVLPYPTDATQAGNWEISGIKVKSTEKAPETGDLEVYVSGKDDTKVTAATVKVATVAEYGTELTVAEKKDITSGKNQKVKITYKETTKDSVGRCDVDFVLSQGYIKKASVTALGATPIYKDAKKPKDTEIIGFTITTTADDTEAEKFIDGKEIEIVTNLDMSGDVVLSTSGRYVEDQEVVVAEIKPNFTVAAEAMTLKVGQSKQVGGKFVITEAEKGAFAKNTVITLNLPVDDGISFTELPTVTVDGNAKVKTEWANSTSKSAINITLTKASKETPATITVEGLEVKVDRTVPQGAYDLKLGVSDYNGELKSAEFFVVGTPNTEELAANGLPKGTATFTIGSTQYTVNGKVATMDAAAYIQDPGYTMVPVRYVAEAFGVTGNDIVFSNGTATIFAGTRTIQLTNNSDIAVVNGVQIKMATKVVIKDGRTYAPIGEVAQLLGISKDWQAETKTAAFENK